MVTEPGYLACQARNLSAGQPEASEQPALRSGMITLRVGFRIFAVSAMKCTPQNTITSASVFLAAWASCSESPI
jgi:hypothetical protein